ncbi:MAG: hypothetical protein AAF986_10080 [Pseudomonadota bacterium]
MAAILIRDYPVFLPRRRLHSYVIEASKSSNFWRGFTLKKPHDIFQVIAPSINSKRRELRERCAKNETMKRRKPVARVLQNWFSGNCGQNEPVNERPNFLQRLDTAGQFSYGFSLVVVMVLLSAILYSAIHAAPQLQVRQLPVDDIEIILKLAGIAAFIFVSSLVGSLFGFGSCQLKSSLLLMILGAVTGIVSLGVYYMISILEEGAMSSRPYSWELAMFFILKFSSLMLTALCGSLLIRIFINTQKMPELTSK